VLLLHFFFVLLLRFFFVLLLRFFFVLLLSHCAFCFCCIWRSASQRSLRWPTSHVSRS
jgi:hypothetical protein